MSKHILENPDNQSVWLRLVGLVVQEVVAGEAGDDREEEEEPGQAGGQEPLHPAPALHTYCRSLARSPDFGNVWKLNSICTLFVRSP